MRLPSRTPVDVALELAAKGLAFLWRRVEKRTGLDRVRRSL